MAFFFLYYTHIHEESAQKGSLESGDRIDFVVGVAEVKDGVFRVNAWEKVNTHGPTRSKGKGVRRPKRYNATQEFIQLATLYV